MKRIVPLAIGLLLVSVRVAADDGDPYVQHKDVVYGQAHGVGLLMDVFVPTGAKNGYGVIDIASGAWHSDRGKIRDHKMAQMYDHFCGRGYTVFAVRPGSRTRFTVDDMLENINTAIRYVREHAEEYGINPDKLGITGASAGGHLTLMTLVKGAPESNAIAAAGVFFPPTNFLDWDGEDADLTRLGDLFFHGGADGQDPALIRAKAGEHSPGVQIKDKLPAMILFHGDADPVVPLQQSELLVERLEALGSDIEFHVKPGGGHPWLTIHEEVEQMAEWFDENLATD